MFLIISILSLVGLAMIGLGVCGWIMKMAEDGSDIHTYFSRKFKSKWRYFKDRFNS